MVFVPDLPLPREGLRSPTVHEGEDLSLARWAIAHGDALAMLRSMPDACVDAVITDEPYSSGGMTRGDRMVDTREKYVVDKDIDPANIRADFAGDNRDQRSFLAWCAVWLAEALRVAKPGAPLVMFSDWRQLPTVTDAIQCGGWVWRGLVPWDKTEGVRPQMGRFAAQCEYVAWGSAGPMREDLAPVIGCLPGLVRCAVRKEDKHHQVGKPTAVMQALVRIAPPGGIVLDPFAGSSTTGVACILEGRRYLGFEMVPHYLSTSVERLEAAGRSVGLEEFRAGQAGLFERPTEPAPPPVPRAGEKGAAARKKATRARPRAGGKGSRP